MEMLLCYSRLYLRIYHKSITIGDLYFENVLDRRHIYKLDSITKTFLLKYLKI